MSLIKNAFRSKSTLNVLGNPTKFLVGQGFCESSTAKSNIQTTFSIFSRNSFLNQSRPFSSQNNFKSNNGKSETEKKAKSKFVFPKYGPLSPIGLSLFGMAAISVYYYFTVEKERMKKKSNEELKANLNVGKPKIGGPFELVDQNNNVVTEKTFLGKHTLIYFGFCHCPDICPDELDKIGEALTILDKSDDTKDKIVPIFITCDPQRDTPEVIKNYLEEFHPKFVGLTGTIEQIQKACKAYRVYFSKPPKVEDGQNYLVDHSIFSYLMDQNSVFVDIYGKDRTSEEMAKSIRSYLLN
ncbi:Protein SCO1, mitochondrial [Smittium culicis]|uniref:Protein SCO1, mitochondrial n=1 Tax=Smittium culicis TaxID=133412 RepID=A0A1R1XZP5_9FUNG|nr:Protein SCO1, mitochondrial [Smittium culicis]